MYYWAVSRNVETSKSQLPDVRMEPTGTLEPGGRRGTLGASKVRFSLIKRLLRPTSFDPFAPARFLSTCGLIHERQSLVELRYSRSRLISGCCGGSASELCSHVIFCWWRSLFPRLPIFGVLTEEFRLVMNDALPQTGCSSSGPLRQRLSHAAARIILTRPLHCAAQIVQRRAHRQSAATASREARTTFTPIACFITSTPPRRMCQRSAQPPLPSTCTMYLNQFS